MATTIPSTALVPLAPRTARAIDLAIGERTEGPIFLALDDRRLDRHGAGRIARRTARHAGITKPVGPHTLRHAFITAALDAEVPLRDVQEAASHADPRTTMRYDRARTLAGPARHVYCRRHRRRSRPIGHPQLVDLRLAGLRPGGPPPETLIATSEKLLASCRSGAGSGSSRRGAKRYRSGRSV